jgi:catechol 1,2-dioxygenase
VSNRAAELVGEMFGRLHQLIAEHDISYDEYRAAKQWLIDVGDAGEWPLLLDVFVESAIEKQTAKAHLGSEGTILGPYYLPDAPVLKSPYEMPHRPHEAGEPLVMAGRVTTVDGAPLDAAVLDIWHADANGLYSGFSDIPAGILRGKLITDARGGFRLRTIMPAPYTIPHGGPTGRMIAACDWHPWRPAHIHLLVSAEGYQTLTTQLYIDTSDYVDDDVASAVKDSLIVHPEGRPSDPQTGIDGPHLHFDYEFRLEPARAAVMVG